MSDVFPDILRSTITDVLLLILLSTMARPRYRPWTIIVPSIIIIAANVALNMEAYLRSNYTLAVHVSIFIIVPWVMIMKPLIKDSIMQWCFNVVTAENVLAVVVFVSYRCARLTPFPEYANIIVRVILFVAVIIAFRFLLKPLYLRALEHGKSYFLATLGLLFCFAFEFGFSGGLEKALQSDTVLLTLLSLTTVFVYLAIFLSLRSISKTYELHEAVVLADARREALQMELETEQAYIDAARSSRHNQRHRDAAILEYLESGHVDRAIGYLRATNQSTFSHKAERFCENTIANAMLCITARRCRAVGILFICEAEIPEHIPLSPTETSDLFGNLLENACEACESTPDLRTTIVFKAIVDDGILRIEERNTSPCAIDFAAGMPTSTKTAGDGIGTKSMRAIVERADGMLRFSAKDGEFIVQIVLPL